MKFPIKAFLSIALLASSGAMICITDADLTPENLAKAAAQFDPNKKGDARNELSFLAGKVLEEQKNHGTTKQQLETINQELNTINQELGTIKGSRWYQLGRWGTAQKARAAALSTGAQESVVSYKTNYSTNASRTVSAFGRIGAALLHIPFRGVTGTVNGVYTAGSGIASGAQSAWSKVPARPTLPSVSMPSMQSMPSMPKIGWPAFFNRTK